MSKNSKTGMSEPELFEVGGFEPELFEVGGFTPQPHEAHLYHVETERVAYDPVTGKKLSKPFVRKLTDVEYKLFKQHENLFGYTTTILHEPKAKQETGQDADLM